MINKFNIKLAWIWLSRPREKLVFVTSFFGLVGIVIGVATLIVVMSVMNGFRHELEKNIRGLSNDISIIPSNKKFISHYDDVNTKIGHIASIENVSKIISGQALLVSSLNSSGVIFRGINPKDLHIKKQIVQGIISGSAKNFSQNDSIMLGVDLARSLHVKVGDQVKIILPEVNNTIMGSMPRMKELNIIAIYKTHLYEYDAGIVTINYDLASKFLQSNNMPNIIEVNVKYDNDLSKTLSEIRSDLSGSGLIVNSWRENNAQFFNALKIERVAMFCILSLIIIVAMFNILLSQFMTVKDRKEDIAILRSFGASKYDILVSFIIHSMYIGLIGVVAGIVVGYLLSSNIESIKQSLEYFSGYTLFEPAIYFLSYLPSKIILSDLMIIAGMTLSICFLGSIYPSYRAANMSVMEAIRYE